jgi:hypothetical protein
MVHILQPQLRKTSEIRYHSDLAPGNRFVFVGRVIDPISRLYIVGREVKEVRPDQPEWLDDHRHNCPTFYVLIGGYPDLTGLAAEIVIEGQRFLAEAPAAIMLPTGFLHHHRLVSGSGWSFHVNVRHDYEESLMDDLVDGTREVEVRVDRLYRKAEEGSQTALGWESRDGSIPTSTCLGGATLWKFIDPDEFKDPGVRLHALQVPAGTQWCEAPHAHAGDEVNIVLSDHVEPLELEVASETGMVSVRSPVGLYHEAGSRHCSRRVAGRGLFLKFLRL